MGKMPCSLPPQALLGCANMGTVGNARLVMYSVETLTTKSTEVVFETTHHAEREVPFALKFVLKE